MMTESQGVHITEKEVGAQGPEVAGDAERARRDCAGNEPLPPTRVDVERACRNETAHQRRGIGAGWPKNARLG